MKKTLLTLLLCSLAAVSTRADLVYSDSFNYTNGQIIVTSTNGTALLGAPAGSTNWFRHSGTSGNGLVNNNKYEIAATGGSPIGRSDDVHCNFTTTATNTQTILYSSFTVRCLSLPPAVGTYIGHFYVNGTTFHGRVFAQSPAGVLPGTWRLGISGAANAVNKIFAVDLATNVDYQVVVQWDPVTLFAATLWVNPISSADPNTGATIDGVTTPAASVGYGFRQAGTFGNFFGNISNLVVATTFEEAATNVWSTNAVAPIIVRSPVPGTNFLGDPVNLIALASGQGLGSITYQWQKEGANVSNPNGNSNVFNIGSAAISDTGNYRMIATTPFGLSVTSATAFLWVTNAPIPPTILPATNTTVAGFYHQSVALQVTASGPPVITYAWYYTNAPVTSPYFSGDGTPTLTISDVFTNNDTTGAFYCVASNPYGSKTSGVFTVTVSGPPAVSIAFLRTLADPTTYIATNSNLRWQATGTVTTLTNLTSGDTSSYYLQDATGGINIFVTHGGGSDVANVRWFSPQQGDVVTFVGWLSSFNSTLELEGDTNDVTTGWTILSNNLASIPPAKVIPFSITNNLAFCETNLEGSIIMLTNVYFGTNAGVTISSTANTVANVTNAAGEGFQVFFSSQDLDTVGKTIPAFAHTIVGPMTQNLGNGVVPRNQTYQVTVTRFSDIVTTPLSLNVTKSGNSAVLTWEAAPFGYSYTVLSATSVTGPYTPLATGLRFTTSSGTYTDTSASAAAKFYRLTTP